MGVWNLKTSNLPKQSTDREPNIQIYREPNIQIYEPMGAILIQTATSSQAVLFFFLTFISLKFPSLQAWDLDL